MPAYTNLPAAVLWDMDGTLVDTEPYWIAAELKLSERDGGSWTHADGLTIVGSELVVAAQQLRERGGIKGTDAEIVDDLLLIVIAQVRTHGIPWRPGAAAAIQAVRDAGIPCALVTMSYLNLASVIIEALPPGTFSSVITGEIVEHGKPHPEPYLKAARELGVAIGDCVAIEDSPTGIASAEAAGAHVLAVKFLVDIPAAAGRSRVASLESIGIAELCLIANGTVIDQII
jgi:HAD superfamily hydrolase (TIGR01509 family)